MPYYAHIRQDENGQTIYQTVAEHLTGTAALCREFAADFGAEARQLQREDLRRKARHVPRRELALCAVESELYYAVQVMRLSVLVTHFCVFGAREAAEHFPTSHELRRAHGVLRPSRDAQLTALALRRALGVLGSLRGEQREQRLLRGVFVVCACEIEFHVAGVLMIGFV